MPIARAVTRQPGKVGLRQQHQRIQRIAVLAEGVVDEPVIGRILGRGEQRPVQPDPARMVVHLVFVATALGDFDGHVEVHECHLSRVRLAGRRWPKSPAAGRNRGHDSGLPRIGGPARARSDSSLDQVVGLAVRQPAATHRCGTRMRRPGISSRRRHRSMRGAEGVFVAALPGSRRTGIIVAAVVVAALVAVGAVFFVTTRDRPRRRPVPDLGRRDRRPAGRRCRRRRSFRWPHRTRSRPPPASRPSWPASWPTPRSPSSPASSSTRRPAPCCGTRTRTHRRSPPPRRSC